MDGNGHKPPIPSTTLTLTITFDQMTGLVSVNGALQNEMISLYMLEKARDAAKGFAAEQAQGKRILPATAVPFLKQ